MIKYLFGSLSVSEMDKGPERINEHLMNKTMITAHSGCEGTGIDTMDSVEKALEIGADAIEIDIRSDPFGNLRISHDPLSLESYLMKNLLEEVFHKIRPVSVKVNFDIKEKMALYRTLETAETTGFPKERMILTGSTTPDDLLEDRELPGRADFFLNISHVLKYVYIHRREEFTEEMFTILMEEPLMLVIDEDTPVPDVYLSDAKKIRQKLFAVSKTLREKICEDTLRVFQDTRAKALNLPKLLLDTRFMKMLNTAGIPLSFWTVNDPDRIARCLELGVCNITTRAPRSALRIRDHYLCNDDNTKEPVTD